MRKMITLALVFLLLICGTAHAEIGIDLDPLTDTELVDLYNQVTAKMAERNIQLPGANLIADGMYTAGVSIKPGMYKITCTEAYNEEGVLVNTFADEGKFTSYRLIVSRGEEYEHLGRAYLTYTTTISTGRNVIVQLTEGMVLHLSGGICEIQAVNANWMP